jgi:1-acyl-sn-glycerol-3-phosphate acyltransferase
MINPRYPDIMRHSIFSTPIVTPILRFMANSCLKLCGWRVEANELPSTPYVFIGAPHTSNWDFMLLIAGVLHLHLDIRWMGKHTLFPPVIGTVMRWMGGIPVNRTKAHSMVSRMADLIREEPDTILCIPPEGTRSKVKEWKSGFYHIARQAQVPILLAAIDAENKTLRMLGEFKPGDDLDSDMQSIQAAYKGLKGIRPENT